MRRLAMHHSQSPRHANSMPEPMRVASTLSPSNWLQGRIKGHRGRKSSKFQANLTLGMWGALESSDSDQSDEDGELIRGHEGNPNLLPLF